MINSNRRTLVCGFGINDADYEINQSEYYFDESGKKKRKLITCPYYSAWQRMIVRCYSKISLKRHPTYEDCFVSEEWKYFSNFKAWMETQDWENNQLDKDLLVKDNKEYGPTTCLFVSSIVNGFLKERKNLDRDLPIGVQWDKRKRNYRAKVSYFGKNKWLGNFKTVEEAYYAYRKAKFEIALEIASQQTNIKIAEALINRYRLEISDD